MISCGSAAWRPFQRPSPGHYAPEATSGSSFPTKDRLDSMRRNAMSRSFTWELSAACYCALYRKAVSP
jgi:starch synthase